MNSVETTVAKKYMLYNPLSGSDAENTAHEALTGAADTVSVNMLEIGNYKDFFESISEDDAVVICGGDGTLNRFVNDTKDIDIKNKIYYYAMGSGNDFARDIGHATHDTPDFEINEYITNLPTVRVNGKEMLFINGVGYGIDGYCCEVGDDVREYNKTAEKPKKIDYTAIAIKGLLFKFAPRNATVWVDGEKHEYKKVWIAPTMNGRFYGGGMMPTPSQQRIGGEKKLSLMVFHGSGKLKTLMIFPSLFKGEHIKHTKHVTVHEGTRIRVEFDRPTPIQIDGETIRGVTSYEAVAAEKQ